MSRYRAGYIKQVIGLVALTSFSRRRHHYFSISPAVKGDAHCWIFTEQDVIFREYSRNIEVHFRCFPRKFTERSMYVNTLFSVNIHGKLTYMFAIFRENFRKMCYIQWCCTLQLLRFAFVSCREVVILGPVANLAIFNSSPLHISFACRLSVYTSLCLCDLLDHDQ